MTARSLEEILRLATISPELLVSARELGAFLGLEHRTILNKHSKRQIKSAMLSPLRFKLSDFIKPSEGATNGDISKGQSQMPGMQRNIQRRVVPNYEISPVSEL